MERDSWNSCSLEENLILERKGERNNRGDEERESQRGRALISVCVCVGSDFFFFSFLAAKVLLGRSSSRFLEPHLPRQGVSGVINFLTVTWQPSSLSSLPLGLFTSYTAPYWLADVQQTGPLSYNVSFAVLPTLAVVFCLFCLEHTSAERLKLFFPR